MKLWAIRGSSLDDEEHPAVDFGAYYPDGAAAILAPTLEEAVDLLMAQEPNIATHQILRAKPFKTLTPDDVRRSLLSLHWRSVDMTQAGVVTFHAGDEG